MSSRSKEGRRDLPERSARFAKEIVGLCRDLDRDDPVHRMMNDHLLPAATLVGAHVASAQAAPDHDEFLAMYAKARQAARESHYWLNLLTETTPSANGRVSALADENNQLIAILTTILKHGKGSA